MTMDSVTGQLPTNDRSMTDETISTCPGGGRHTAA